MSWRSRRRVEEARPKSIGMRLCLLIVNQGGWASGAQDGCRPGVQVVENAVAVTGGLIPCGSTSGRAEWPAITSLPGRVKPNASGWKVIGGLAFGHGRPTPTERRSVPSALIFRRRSWTPWRAGNSKHSEIAWLDRSQPFRHLRGYGAHVVAAGHRLGDTCRPVSTNEVTNEIESTPAIW